MEFADCFTGHVGFEELKKHCRQGDEFSREVLAVLMERASCELTYSKSIKRLSIRLNKACSNLMTSPLSTLWKTISLEMEKEAEAHRKCWSGLSEDTLKPSAPVLENLSKSRKNEESCVDGAFKVMSDKILEHSKLKKRDHQLSKEKEVICDQLEGARPKTKNDETKLAQKQSKAEVLLSRADDEYYNALLELQRLQTEWELASQSSCTKMQELERCKMEQLCRIAMSFSSSVTAMSQQLASSCEQVSSHAQSLDPEGETRIVVQNRKLPKYQTEMILCDYFYENFTNRIKEERRVTGLSKQLEKFLGDLQKERAHKQGICNLIRAQSSRASEDDKIVMDQRLTKTTRMLTFLDLNRSKLQKAISSLRGANSMPLHRLTSAIQQHPDKLGIMHSTVKLPFNESSEDEDFFHSSSQADEFLQRPQIQRTQSESYSVDDLSVGRHHESRSQSYNKGGTLTAKQIRSLQAGFTAGRKQAPAPPRNHSIHKSRTSNPKCIAKYRYDSRESDELTIEEGDVILLLEKCDADWWKGELRGNVGIFPATYVEEVSQRGNEFMV